MTTLYVLPEADHYCMADDLWSFTRELVAAEIAKAEKRGRESMRNEYESLKLFAMTILADFPELGNFDGGDIQEMAVACGLLIGKEVAEPCSEGCNCVEYADLDPEGKFLYPMTCYHKAEFLK